MLFVELIPSFLNILSLPPFLSNICNLHFQYLSLISLLVTHFYSGPRLNIYFSSEYSPQSNFREIIYIKIIFFNGAVWELMRLVSCNIVLCKKYIKYVNKVQIYICILNCIIFACLHYVSLLHRKKKDSFGWLTAVHMHEFSNKKGEQCQGPHAQPAINHWHFSM